MSTLPGYAAVVTLTTIVVVRDTDVHVIQIAELPNTFRVVQAALAQQTPYDEIASILPDAV